MKFAGDETGEGLSLGALISRQEELCARLARYDGLKLIQSLSELLTQPANHVATFRIEALIHLAVIFCQGNQIASSVQVSEWLNWDLARDQLGRGEEPIEDVFATVVPAWGGSVVLLEGAWLDNGYCLQNLLAALLRLRGESWVDAAYHHVMALLQLAREISSRAGIERYIMSKSAPSMRVTVSPGTATEASSTRFSLADLFRLNIVAKHIAPFVLGDTQLDEVRKGVLGNSVLERRPLLRQGNDWLVALPTAIGAAARRFILEVARSEGVLPRLEEALRFVEFQDIHSFVIQNLGFVHLSSPARLDERTTLWSVKFGEGCYGVIAHVADDLDGILQSGLQRINLVDERIMVAVSEIETGLARQLDYRHGLTVFLYGGVGRGYSRSFASSPIDWHRVDLNLGDATRLSWDGDFTAKRIWKILALQEQLPPRGFHIQNSNGFLNLYGYLQERNFEPVPVEMTTSSVATLDSGHVGLARHRIRTASDYHLVLGPDARSLVEVQRRSTSSYFKEVSQIPLFVSPFDALNDRLRAVVETDSRPWWVDHNVGPLETRLLTIKIWDAAQKWLVRLAPMLEGELINLPPSPIAIELIFSDLRDLQEMASVAAERIARPSVTVFDGVIKIDSTMAALRGYIHETNIAERYLISAMALGVSELAGLRRSLDWADGLAVTIAGSTDARFAHAIPAGDAPEMLQASVSLPKPVYQADEDRAWTDLELAKLAGASGPGIVAEDDVGPLLQNAVLRLWERIRGRLVTIDRRSLVVKAFLNHEAIDRDRAEWAQTAAALLALHEDQADVLSTHNEQEGKRSSAGVASRALAEMAICTCPTSGGMPCTEIDFDQLLSEVCSMIDCATQCDAHYYHLATGPLQITPSGCFLFDTGFYEQLHRPYIHAHGDRAFRDAASAYADAFDQSEVEAPEPTAPVLDPDFLTGVRAEFGMRLDDLVHLSHRMAERALEERQAIVSMTLREFRDSLAQLDSNIDVDRAYVALTLRPRPEWNEQKPAGALARDWQPWRMNRKLSLTRRPIIQLDDSEDPEILISPVLLSRVVRRVFNLVDGKLGAELFDSKEIGKWIGKVVDERGHAFNHAVAERLMQLGLNALPDQLMTQFNAKKELGDVDVLAWSDNGEVWIIECKRLLLDRTVGEVGERLADYTTLGTRNKKRTPIQKHLDRVGFFKSNLASLSKLTGIGPERMRLRSALVTSGIVPMQFTKTMTSLVDVATDFRSIGSAGFAS